MRIPGSLADMAGLDDDQQELLLSLVWDWVLDPMAFRHCPDCPVLAAGSPYTSETLPAIPGDGHTRCLDRCRCHLEYHFAADEPGIIVTPTTPGPDPLPAIPSGVPYPGSGGDPYAGAGGVPYPGATGAVPYTPTPATMEPPAPGAEPPRLRPVDPSQDIIYPRDEDIPPYHEGVDLKQPPADVYIPPFSYRPRREEVIPPVKIPFWPGEYRPEYNPDGTRKRY